MGNVLPVISAASPYAFIVENMGRLKAQLADAAVEAYENPDGNGYEFQRLGERVSTLAEVERHFRLNGWDKVAPKLSAKGKRAR